MCYMLEEYTDCIHVGWTLWLPTQLAVFLDIEVDTTLKRAKKRAEYIMRKMAEAFAPLVEVKK